MTEYKSDFTTGKILKCCGPQFFMELKPTAGDFSCLLSLFFDNLSTIVTFAGIFSYVVGDAAGDVPGANDILYKKIIPALGVALFIGNVYYAILATRMKAMFGRDFTAQPYGVNTVGGFPFLFNIMLPIAIATGSIEKAWEAGCSCNFLVGLINIGLGALMITPVFSNFVLNHVPIHALTIPVAGVGITWLSINQIAPCFGTPVAGFVPMIMIFMMYYSKNPISIGAFKVPEVLHWIIPGFIMGWIYGLPPAAQEGYEFPDLQGGLWAGNAFLSGFEEIGDHMGILVPVAIVASAGGLMCLVSAYNAGDPYPIGETMITDGLFTIVGAILGSPFGTVIYFGHPIHKKLGGKYFFSFANGVIYLILTLSGIFPIALDISPKVAIGPTIFIFGLMLCEECTLCIPQRHHAIIFFGLFFSWCDYFGDKGGPLENGEEGAGLSVMKSGYLLNAMIWSCILVYTIDRKWLTAVGFCLFAAVLAFVGLIHQPSIDFEVTTEGSHLGGNNAASPTTPRYSTSPLQCALAYCILAIVMGIMYMLRKMAPGSYEPPIDAKGDEADDLALNSKLVVIGSLDEWWKKGPATEKEGGGSPAENQGIPI